MDLAEKVAAGEEFSSVHRPHSGLGGRPPYEVFKEKMASQAAPSEAPKVTQSGRVLPPLRLQSRPGVPERERAVEHDRPGRRVGIGAEVAEPLELHGLAGG